MYFSTFSTYDDQKSDITKDDMCFICWEPYTDDKGLVKMNSLSFFSVYYKSCKCNGIIHSDCLLEWIDNSQSCPICRKEIQLQTDEQYFEQNKYKTQLQRIFIFMNVGVFKICRYLFVLLLLHNLFHIITDIQYTIERQYDNTTIEREYDNTTIK